MARLKVNGKTGVRLLDFRTAHKNVLLMAKWKVVIRMHKHIVYNMSESNYVISSYEGSKILLKRNKYKSDLNPNSEKYEGVKY